MPSTSDALSRRRLLATGGSALSLAVAGCAEGISGETTVGANGSDGPATEFESTHEYESLSVRSSDSDHFVYRTAEEVDEAEANADDEFPSPYRRSVLFVLDTDDADALWIDPDAVDDVGAAEIRSFVADTDFETESIVVDQRPIEDCYHRRILGLRAADDEFRTQYCWALKDPMTPCEADTEVMEAIVYRIQRPYDDAPSSRSSSESRSCRGPVVVDGAVTSDEANETLETNGSNGSNGTETEGTDE